MKQKIKIKLKQFWHIYGTPKMLVSFGIAWLITNGWSYVCLYIGKMYGITWLTTISASYIAFLFLPFTVEKIVTIWIATRLHKIIFRVELENKEK